MILEVTLLKAKVSPFFEEPCFLELIFNQTSTSSHLTLVLKTLEISTTEITPRTTDTRWLNP